LARNYQGKAASGDLADSNQIKKLIIGAKLQNYPDQKKPPHRNISCKAAL